MQSLKIVSYSLVVVIIILFSCNNNHAYSDSQQVLITKSGSMDKIIFDGKWSYTEEWKESSDNAFSYNNGTEIQLRTAHQDDFIYIFVDDVSNNHFEKGSDEATVCFDMNDKKPTIANSNDYCFMDILGGDNSFILQGGSPLASMDNFKKIENPLGFIGIGAVSDQNDRYSIIPHPSYEFRIPINLIGRSDHYGFYLGVYNTHSNKVYSWPQNVTADSFLIIPSPSKWGDLISPDASLPEFPWPILALVLSVMIITYMTKRSVIFHE